MAISNSPSNSTIQPTVSLRVVCFGDSITGTRPREAYRHNHLKYSDLLQLMLEARLGLENAEVLNRGFAGQTSGEARARLREDLLDEAPHLAIVLIGGNDASRAEISSTQTVENLRAIFAASQSAGIRVLALQYHFLPGEEAATAWHWLAGNNALIAQVADEFAFPVLDMNPIFQQAEARTSRSELVNLEDGVHLNPGGEIVYARAIFTRLDELKWI